MKKNIPKNIFQTWKTKDLTGDMKETVNRIKELNPDYRHVLFDDTDCRQFIKHTFNQDTLDAYDKLLPGAFKADLFRYCILFMYGGIYLDIKYAPVNEFCFDTLIDKSHFVMDMDKDGIYNALMICKAKEPILLNCIHKIIHNVKHNYYGNHPLEVTGPKMMKQFIYFKNSMIDLNHYCNPRVIVYKNTVLLKEYSTYRSLIRESYADMWKEKNIYSNDNINYPIV